MKSNFFLPLGLFCLLLLSACQNAATNKISPSQNKVNAVGEFIVTDDRDGKTELPYATQSSVQVLVKNYWGTANPVPKDNVFSIEDLLQLYGTDDKIVFAVDNIPSQQVHISVLTFTAAQKRFTDAEKGTTYYYVLDKSFLTRKTPSNSQPDGIMYNKLPNGERVRQLTVSIGTDIRGNQNWYYLIVQPDFNSGGIQLRGEPDGVGVKIPDPVN
jgi:hypothetical protein